jgi:nitroimidazol reductase NimA-like FMN-containing flavoprotein (pyridoxamine 5'-phosphate oxidase superfamily)
MRLQKAHAQLVALERICRVATTGGRGAPHVVPVCHVLIDGKIWFASEKNARKVRNLRENPRIAVTVDLYAEAWASLRGVMIQGTARVVAKSPTFRRIRKALYAKYPQYPDESAIGDDDSVVVEVTPSHVFAWGFD